MTSAFKSNKMKSSFLLILSVITGCESLPEVKTCKIGWVQFTCNKAGPQYCTMAPSGKHQPTKRKITLKMSTKKTNCHQLSDRQELKFEVEENGCPKPFYQNVNKTDIAIIRCDYPQKLKSHKSLFCRERDSSCVCGSSENSPLWPKFNVSETSTGFNVSISNVSSQDAGAYWCVIRSYDNNLSLKQIQLKVIVSFSRSAVIGQNFSYWCKYQDASLTKFICKGDDPATCQPLVNTTNTGMNMKFSMNDNKTQKNISITVREVTGNDSGTYWCGAEGPDKQRFVIHRFSVTVVSPTPAPRAASSPAAVTAAAGTHGVSEAVTSVIICAALLPSLLFLVVLILIYKRFSCSKNTGNRAEEECTYEEIQERLQPPETAANTIYVTVNSPSRAASTHYATVNFPNPAQAGSEALKPSSSACQYSTVQFTSCPTSSSVTQLHQTTEEPLYATVNKPLRN